MTAGSKKFVIAIDEFQRDPYFMLGAAIASESQAVAIEKKWTALRLKIKEQLLIDKPSLSIHRKLVGDQLPEIHAVDLVQSTSYYRIGDSQNPEYWHRQYIWLEEALKIIKHYQIKFIFAPIFDYKARFNKDGEILTKLLEQEVGIIIDERHRKEIFRRATHPYIRQFSSILGDLDGWLSQNQAHCRLICDEYNDCSEFSQLDCYSILQSNGLFHRINPPIFLSSTDEALIQIADVGSYILGKVLYDVGEQGKNEKHIFHHQFPVFKKWYTNYINPTDLKAEKFGRLGDEIPYSSQVIKLVLAEMIFLKSGGNPTARVHLASAFQAIVDQTFPK